MNNFLKPSIKFMNKLTYLKKFTVILLIFLLPVIIFITQTIINVNEEVKLAESRRNGLEFTLGLKQLINDVQQHRGLSSLYIGGNNSLKYSLLQKQQHIDSDISTVEIIEKKYSSILKITPDWEIIKNQWLQLRDQFSTLSLDESFDTHTSLIRNMIMLNKRVAENSRLTLQSKIENYSLMNSIINQLPILAENMGQLRAIGAGAAENGFLDEKTKGKILYLLSEIDNELKIIDNEMETLIEVPHIKNNIEKASDEAFSTLHDMIGTVNQKILNSHIISIDSNEYFNLTTNSINKMYNLLILNSNTLNEISMRNLNNLILKRNLLIILIIFVLTLIIYLFIGFYQSIIGTIKAIENATRKISSGDYRERVKLGAKDETKKIETYLNDMIDILIKNYEAEKEAKKLMESLAHHDSLTGLPNRTLIIKELDKAMEKSRQSGKITAVMFMDLDEFKMINDVLGHETGDLVLKTVGAQLTGVVANRGMVGRLGGDEYIVILPEVGNLDKIESIRKEIIETIKRPWTFNDCNYNIGISIGYTIYTGDEQTSEELINHADMEMYKVKRQKKINR